LEAVRNRAGIGLGDAKLFAAAGAWLGLAALPSVMLWTCGVALVAVSAAHLLKRPLDASSRIPFGPFLSLVASGWSGFTGRSPEQAR
jgi:leader peptidase (prepilin peptidase)/N-methyltransferase